MKGYGAIIAIGGLLLFPPPCGASSSSSPNFSNARSSLNSAGQRLRSSGYTLDSTLGELAVTTHSGSGFLSRTGLMPAYHYPGRISDLTAGGCREGEIALAWTAPGNDGHAPGTSARSYILKLSTSPDLSPSLSESLFQAAPSPEAEPPPPQAQGARQSLLLLRPLGLEPGATYYFAILALEADGTPGPLSGVTARPEDRKITGLAGATGFRRSLLSWDPLPPVEGTSLCTPSAYRVYRTTEPAAPFALVMETSSPSYTDEEVVGGTTYYYRIAAVNTEGAEFNTSGVQAVRVRTASPLPPARIDLVRASPTVVSWEAPQAFSVGLPFANPGAPKPDELSGFRVWRSTDLYQGWAPLATLPPDTLRFVDEEGRAGEFYKVTALNDSDESESSLIRDSELRAGYALAPDGRSHVMLPQEAVEALSPDPWTAYRIQASQDQEPAGGVFNSARFEVVAGTSAPRADFKFPALVRVRLGYKTSPSGTLVASAKPVPPSQTSVYWHNGARWVKLYGLLDAQARHVSAETERLGDFQLRLLERTADFNFNPGGVSNRLITPNGDGRNDFVVFTFDNPRDSQVVGKIFDLKGALVATLPQTGQSTLEWDGKADGRPVPGGVYIYQIEGDEKIFNGTVVVIR